MKKNKKGFTLIELLIVISIIGILASIVIVALNNSRANANSAVLKTAISSIAGGVSVCCDSGERNLQTIEGADVCSPGVNALLPTAENIKAESVSYSVAADCNTIIPTLNITPVGHMNDACNATIEVRNNGIFTNGTAGFPDGC